MKKIVAVMPIKTNNERLPGKNIRMLGGKPLMQYELDELIKTGLSDIYVYCSDDTIKNYLPSKVNFLKRDSSLDLPTSNFSQIFDSFMDIVDADIYIYAHATAPFISSKTILECLDKVENEGYDSAFCATKIQDFLWCDGEPMNFNASNLPRSQDLKIIHRETSGIYIFTKDMYKKYHRRIGMKPFIKEVGYKESVDINNFEDFELAKVLLDIK